MGQDPEPHTDHCPTLLDSVLRSLDMGTPELLASPGQPGCAGVCGPGTLKGLHFAKSLSCYFSAWSQ